MDCINAAIWCLIIQIWNANKETEMKKNAIRRGTDFTVTIGLKLIIPLDLITSVPVIARLSNIKLTIMAIT